jgi:hypothetical protein
MSGVRQAVAVLLVLLFSANLRGFGAQTATQAKESAASLKDQVDELPMGAFIEVRFMDKTKVRGYLSAVETDGLSFKTGEAANGNLRQTSFSDVKSVKVLKKTHTPTTAWIATGAVVAVAVVAIVLLVTFMHGG